MKKLKQAKQEMVNIDALVWDKPPAESAVAEWERRMRAGDGIPAVVMRKGRSGKYDVIDGRARVKAAKRCGWPTALGYIVDVSDKEALELRKHLNLLTSFVKANKDGAVWMQRETLKLMTP